MEPPIRRISARYNPIDADTAPPGNPWRYLLEVYTHWYPEHQALIAVAGRADAYFRELDSGREDSTFYRYRMIVNIETGQLALSHSRNLSVHAVNEIAITFPPGVPSFEIIVAAIALNFG